MTAGTALQRAGTRQRQKVSSKLSSESCCYFLWSPVIDRPWSRKSSVVGLSLCLFRKHRVTSPPCWTVSNEQDNLWGQMGGWAHHWLPHMCSPCGLRLLPGKNTIFQFWFPTRSGRSYICIDFLSLSAGRLRSSSVLSQTQRLLPVWHDHVGQQALWCGQTISLHRDIRLPCLDQWCHWRLLKLLSNHVSIALHLFLIHFSQNKNNQKFYHSLIFFFLTCQPIRAKISQMPG